MCIRDSLYKNEVLEKCLLGKTQNPNESLNTVIWSYIPKRIFVELNTLKFRVYIACLLYTSIVNKILVIYKLQCRVDVLLIRILIMDVIYYYTDTYYILYWHGYVDNHNSIQWKQKRMRKATNPHKQNTQKHGLHC